MKILFISVGKKNDYEIGEYIDMYTKRITKYVPVTWKLIENSDKEKEAKAILKSIDLDDYVIALDEKGKDFTSEKLSEKLDALMGSGKKQVIFIIGGSYGLSEEVLKRADFIWSLSKLTFPHQIVRLILSETIFRSFSILKGEPYHHA